VGTMANTWGECGTMGEGAMVDGCNKCQNSFEGNQSQAATT